MEYFLETTETIIDGVGFSHYSLIHIAWLVLFAGVTIANVIYYKKASPEKRSQWRKIIAALLIADELFKMAGLFIGGNYQFSYLPLHLCSINIFVIAYHSFKPNRLLDSILYTVCIPGALAALLFPSWTKLPLGNFMHIHSFTIHILLALYPIVLTCAGDIRPKVQDIPKCVGILLTAAIPITIINLLLGTNFMFLMEADTNKQTQSRTKTPGSVIWVLRYL